MYEVGDKVIYQGADKNAYKKVGVLKSIEEKGGKPQLTVEFEGGETFTAPVDDWSREFTNAYKNAKFKIGDKVIVKGKIVGSKQHDGEVGVVKSIAGTGRPGDPVTVEVHYGPNATWKSGDVVYASPSILKLANSRAANSVVANALKACGVARNAGTVFGKDLDEVSAKLEKCVKGLRGVLDKLGPIQSERNRYIAEGNKYVFVSTPQGDRTSVDRYKKLLEEFSDLVSYTTV